MNTDVAVAAPDLSDAAERELARETAELFIETERRFSRFLPDSELGLLNRAIGPFIVSEELLMLLVRARGHATDTSGVFDAAVGAALQASGYDRSFLPDALDRDSPPSAVGRASITDLGIDEQHRRVTRQPHIQVDLGGFLKGLTVDRAARLAPGRAMIDAGGDAMLPGDWTVEIEDPQDRTRTIGTFVARDQAVATSAANRRRWRRGSQLMHHLIDPRTGTPARTDVLQATVVAPTAELADVMAKVAFIVGSSAAADELERRGLSGILVLLDGTVRIVGAVELHDA